MFQWEFTDGVRKQFRDKTLLSVELLPHKGLFKRKSIRTQKIKSLEIQLFVGSCENINTTFRLRLKIRRVDPPFPCLP